MALLDFSIIELIRKMNNRFSNNETFTPFTHGARGETFLSQFIFYPLRATSATRGTLCAMFRFVFKFRSLFMKKPCASEILNYVCCETIKYKWNLKENSLP
jgi:hypothetical protein